MAGPVDGLHIAHAAAESSVCIYKTPSIGKSFDSAASFRSGEGTSGSCEGTSGAVAGLSVRTEAAGSVMSRQPSRATPGWTTARRVLAPSRKSPPEHMRLDNNDHRSPTAGSRAPITKHDVRTTERAGCVRRTRRRTPLESRGQGCGGHGLQCGLASVVHYS